MTQDRATVHDTLSLDGHVWTVTGVFLGGLHQEDVLGLRVDGSRFDAVAYGKDVPELFVPEILIRKAVEAGIVQLHRATVPA